MSRKNTFLLFLCAMLSGAAAAAPIKEPSGPVVTVHFDYSPKDRAQIHALERRLGSAIKQARVGELGETEFHVDGDEGFLYLYGPDPDRLYQLASPILAASKLMNGAEVTKRYGARTETSLIHRDGSP